MTPCHHDGHGDHQYGDPFGLSTHATLSLHVSLQKASVVGRRIPYLIHEPLRAWLGEWVASEAVTPRLTHVGHTPEALVRSSCRALIND